MSGLEIHNIISKENINKQEWIVSKFSPEQKKEIEQWIDKWLLQWDQILQQDKKINDTLSSLWEKRLFQPHDSVVPTVDGDKSRGDALKFADTNNDWHLATKEYNQNKEYIADAFVRSKQEYFQELDAVGEEEKKVVLNEVHDQLNSLQNSILSTNSYNVSSNNYDPTKRAGNSVPERIATNGLPPEAVGNNAFNYAQNDPNGIQARWNREHGLS
jgi:hypothetical protein